MRMRLFLSFSLLLSLYVLNGCAPVTARPTIDPKLAEQEAAIQKKMAVEEQIELFRRLSRVAQPILTNGVPICGDDVTYFIGMDTNSIDAVAKDWRSAYADALGLEEYVKVTYVLANSPAEKSGFQVGDIITYLNDDKIEPGKYCYRDFQTRLTELLESGKDIEFWIERDGLPKKLVVSPAKRCSYSVVLTEDVVVNAYANGHAVMVTKGMMQFAQKDDELALVIGHEMGHNVMDHIDKQQGNRVMGAVLDGILSGLTGVYINTFQNVGGMLYSQEFEQEADYVGMYFMERGGYDSSNVANFWRRMGASFPYAITHATTHPTSASRYVFLTECHKEIAGKEEAGKDLMPERAETVAKKK
ncbi:M48 family metalloprotease [Pseudodesulfovibrio cashew]|uniref:M48 family metalloprotease n=1 Tax=Pseudodesulfovibrio cashew TaxID=2678688 RepID=A0A6I6JLU9_9BACT|nr:M48 family metallopeptidase [Pseudodesulfovibrio cashew]QGY41272.1 M48 family metalloprotease [Pseudodesulfovibrio cashew]